MAPPRADWHPGTLLALSGSYWQTCALHAGVDLDLFTELAGGPRAAAEIAAAKDLDAEACARLLGALTALGLLTKSDGRYANTPAAAQYLVATSADYIGFMIRHHHQLIAGWSRLAAAVRSGRPVRERSSSSDPQSREAFLMGMYNNSRLIAPQVVPAVDLSGCKRLLDLGGGPGTYAIFFCRQNPELAATVFDLETTRPFAEKVIGQHGLEERIRFQAGDFLEDSLVDADAPYDAVWMSHVLHGEAPADAARLVARAAETLAPGGRLGIHEFILDDDRKGPLFATLFSLNMLLGTEQGRSYTDGELREMMAAAGLEPIERLAVDLPNESGILMGVRSVSR
jgi:SAM-dependent methyltransferase